MTKLIGKVIEVLMVIFFVWLIASWFEVVLFSLYDHEYQSWNLIRLFLEAYYG